MRIKKLELKNFRGFEELVIDFPEGESGLAVFVGVNGAGKSSIVDAIRYFLNEFIFNIYSKRELINKNIKIEDAKDRIPSIYDIRAGSMIQDIRLDFETHKHNFKWEISTSKTTFDQKYYPPIGRFLEGLKASEIIELDDGSGYDTEYLKYLRVNIRENPSVLIIYSTKRTVSDNPSLKSVNVNDLIPIDTFDNSLERLSSFNDFFQWFRSTEDIENQIRLRENPEHIDKGLDTVRKAIQTFINGFSKPYVDRKDGYEILKIKKQDQELIINQLSDGERMMIGIAADIAMRLHIANPNVNQPLSGKGVVLIDEIEQHLHPSWQRTIIPNLRRTFPNIQFILTTHSPQVLSSLKKENVFILDDFKLVKDTPYTLGRDSNSILMDIFNVHKRPKEAEEIFSKLYRVMDDPDKIEKTADMLRDVEERYGYYDAEVVRARSHFQLLNEL